MTLMRAARAHDRTGPLRLEKVAVPEPGPRDVLVRVASAGLAPSLMKLLARGSFKHLPTVPGHEIAGTVTAVGDEADGALVGARVRVHPVLACRTYRFCRGDREQMCPSAAMIGHGAHGSGPMPLNERYHDGGLAEYVRVPSWLVDVLPEEARKFAIKANRAPAAAGQSDLVWGHAAVRDPAGRPRAGPSPAIR